MGYAIAAAVAIPVGLLDQYARLRARPAFAEWTWLWWCGRVFLECAVAAGALFLAKELHVKYTDSWYGWVAAGLLGASLVKSHVAEVSHNRQAVAYGLIQLYEQIRRIFATKIDKASANQQAQWIDDTILPNLQSKGVSATVFADRLRTYVKGLGDLGGVERAEELSWIKETREDAPTVGEDPTRRALVERAAELKAWDWLKKQAKMP
jgi:hypothetical protein